MVDVEEGGGGCPTAERCGDDASMQKQTPTATPGRGRMRTNFFFGADQRAFNEEKCRTRPTQFQPAP